MSVPMRRLAFLLVALAGVCVQLYQAQNISYRCTCPGTVKYVTNITDFEVIERQSGCDKTELVVTIAHNTSNRLCLNPIGKLAKAFFKCWENKNKNETRKHECIDRMNRREK